MQSCEHLIYLVSRAGVRGGDETYESIARKGEAIALQHGYVRLRPNQTTREQRWNRRRDHRADMSLLLGAEIE